MGDIPTPAQIIALTLQNRAFFSILTSQFGKIVSAFHFKYHSTGCTLKLNFHILSFSYSGPYYFRKIWKIRIIEFGLDLEVMDDACLYLCYIYMSPIRANCLCQYFVSQTMRFCVKLDLPNNSVRINYPDFFFKIC